MRADLEQAAAATALPRPAASAGSLQRRLLLAAGAWIALALAAVAWVLVLLFQQHVEQELAERMAEQLDELTAALVVTPAAAPAAGTRAATASVDAPTAPSRSTAPASAGDGPADPGPPSPRLAREPLDPRARQPYGGIYWLVRTPDGQLLRSRSLWDHLPALPWSQATSDAPRRVERGGPRDQPVAWWMRRVELPGVDGPVVVAAGADIAHLQRLTRSYGRTLAASLAVLAVALMGAAWLQVRLGLAPMRRLREALARLRAGRSVGVDGRYPREVQPLVDDLNALLADNAALVEDARRQSGNLAHALKTPLAVLDNAAGGATAPDPALLREQLAAMRRHVDLHLARARAAAGLRARGAAGPATPLAPLAEGLLRTLERLFADRAIALRPVALPPGAALRADAHELHEMLGNLLDNACQWARSVVELRAMPAGEGLLAVLVDDDGPGIPPEHRAEVLQRGRRLDERRPGSGLGLAITDELARLHGGSLRLADAPLGGLRAVLTLPLAPVPVTRSPESST